MHFSKIQSPINTIVKTYSQKQHWFYFTWNQQNMNCYWDAHFISKTSSKIWPLIHVVIIFPDKRFHYFASGFAGSCLHNLTIQSIFLSNITTSLTVTKMSIYDLIKLFENILFYSFLTKPSKSISIFRDIQLNLIYIDITS